MNQRLSKYVLPIMVIVACLAILCAAFLPKEEKKSYVYFGQKRIEVEVARTREEHKTGLVGRDYIPVDHGCLYILGNKGKTFASTEGLKFAVDFIFLKNDTIIDIWENALPAKDKGEVVYSPSVKPDRAVQVNAGFVKANGVKIGDVVRIEIRD